LLMSGRTVGRGLSIHVEMKTPGLLRPGGKIRLAGREIGEVRGMVAMKNHHVDLEAFILSGHAAQVRRNSQLFVNTPSVLGEAYLEVGPPRGEPGPPVADG